MTHHLRLTGWVDSRMGVGGDSPPEADRVGRLAGGVAGRGSSSSVPAVSCFW